jgi:hypothetical protein
MRHAKRRGAVQRGILKARPGLVKDSRWFPVNYASESRFHPSLSTVLSQLFDWEATGILFITDTEIVCIHAPLPSAEQNELRFHRQHSKVKWLGRKKRWQMKPSHWLTVESQGKNHYFTYDTGWRGRGSKAKTWKIYEELSAPPASASPAK